MVARSQMASRLKSCPSNNGVPFAATSSSAPGRTRTCDPRLRRPSLCPAELRGLEAVGDRSGVRPPTRVAAIGRSRRGRRAVAIAASAGRIGDAAGRGRGTRLRTPRPCLVPGVGKPLDQVWQPHMLRGHRLRRHARTGDIAFAVRTDHRFYGYRPDHVEWSASVVKAMLMVAYLDQPSVRDRALNAHDRSLLTPMITESDNDAAQRVFDTVGQAALQALANRVGHDAFRHLPDLGRDRRSRPPIKRGSSCTSTATSPPRHRAYAMSPARRRSSLAALGDRRGRAQGLEALLQGRLGLRHRPARPSGRAARPRLRPRLDRGADHVRRLARLRQGHAEGHLRAPAARACRPARGRQDDDRGARIRTGDLKHPKLAR